jgi:hypothetical protein
VTPTFPRKRDICCLWGDLLRATGWRTPCSPSPGCHNRYRDELSRGSDIGPFGIKLRRGTDGGRLIISQPGDPLDGDDVTAYHVKDPVSADAEAVVPAPVESLSWPPATTGSSLVMAEQFGHDVFV